MLKPAPRWLHHIHHKYNKEHTLSPFAGLAFHPLDGIIQVKMQGSNHCSASCCAPANASIQVGMLVGVLVPLPRR